jgi:hypothetical protein
MYATEHVRYPNDLMRAAHHPQAGMIEATARGLLDSFEEYARTKPVSAALWALGIGFVLGWKLKPW